MQISSPAADSARTQIGLLVHCFLFSDGQYAVGEPDGPGVGDADGASGDWVGLPVGGAVT